MELNKLPLLAFLIVIVPVYTSTTDAFTVIGAVNIATKNNFISQPYPDVTGVRTTSTLDANFTRQCTTCDPSLMSEYCHYEEGTCIKLLDRQIFYFSTHDGSLLYGSPFTISSDCTAKYLQKLSATEFAVICQESYHLFDSTGFSPLAENSNFGILVQLDNVENNFHVEIVDGIVLKIYNLLDPTPVTIYIQGCMQNTPLIHPLFSLSGLFIVSCSSYENKHIYLMYSVDQSTPVISFDLCGDPLSSPSHGKTFAVTCYNTVTVYKIDDVSINYSVYFNTSISNRFYLDNRTLLVIAGTRHYIFNVEVFMSSEGLDGIHTIDGHNCTLPLKLITPDVYAMSCHDGTQYSIHLTAISSGEILAPVENITEQPLDVYFHFDTMSSTPVPSTTIFINSSTSVSQAVTSVPTTSISFPATSITNMIGISSFLQPTPTATPEPTSSSGQSISTNTIIILAVVVASIIVLFLIAAGIIILWFYRSRKQKSKLKRPRGVQETQDTPLTYSNAVYSPANTASVWEHGQ